MSNPDGDEVMNSAQSHIEVALGDITYEKKYGFWQGETALNLGSK